jgi:flagellin-like hook-associated protein FlgL
LRVALKDGGNIARNGDVFAVAQQALTLSAQSYTSKSPVTFDGVQLFIEGTGGSAPVANDVFRVLTTHQYKGDSVDAAIEVGDNLTAQTLVNGNTVFVGPNGGMDVFTALQSLETALLSNNVDGIQAAHASIDRAETQVLAAQGRVGARSNRLSGVRDGLSGFKLDVQTVLSGTEDTDITKAASDLALQQLALQAAAQSATRVLEASLLNYLR